MPELPPNFYAQNTAPALISNYKETKPKIFLPTIAPQVGGIDVLRVSNFSNLNNINESEQNKQNFTEFGHAIKAYYPTVENLYSNPKFTQFLRSELPELLVIKVT
jgi:hypothetical protein